jgi:putative membrane protein
MIDWRHWHNEPFLVGGIVFAGWLYALLAGPLRRYLAPAGTPFPRSEAIKFYAGCAAFYLAVGSPLDQVGERFLLSAHMIQHQLMIYGAAVLALKGMPAWLLDDFLRPRPIRTLGKILFHPITAALVYSLTISVWHAPALYDWALRDKEVHIVEHLMFFGAAIAYWWPIISPSRVLPKSPHASQIMYLVAVTILMTPVFAFIAFSDNVLYPTYEYAPRLIATLSPMDDQLLGAAIMKLGGLVVTFFTLVAIFYRWYQESENRPGKLKDRAASQ